MILVHCPHCQQLIEIVELNCRIFRCGIFKQTGEQLPPHLPKIDCDRLVDVIYGCGKPFIINESEPYVATICDYI